MTSTEPMPVPWDFTDHPRPESEWEVPTGSCMVAGCDEVAVVYNWDFESWSWPQVCGLHMDPRCQGCGSPPSGGDSMGHSSGCQKCLPSTCASCGGINHLATNRSCSCWVSVEDMPLADLKALFARDAEASDGPTLGI